MADVYNDDIEDDNSEYVEEAEGEGEEDDSDLGEEEDDEDAGDAGPEQTTQQPAEGLFAIITFYIPSPMGKPHSPIKSCCFVLSNRLIVLMRELHSIFFFNFRFFSLFLSLSRISRFTLASAARGTKRKHEDDNDG